MTARLIQQGLERGYDALGVRLYLAALDRHKQEPFTKLLAEARQNQHKPLAQLRAESFSKLQTIVRYAEQTEFYRAHFQKHGVRAADLQSPQDILRFPRLSKSDVFDGFEHMRGPAPRGKVFLAKTSGSTGIALRFYTDALHLSWSSAAQWRGRTWWGARRGVRELILWGRPLDDGQRANRLSELKYRLRNSRQFNTFEEFDDRRLEEITETLLRFRPQIVYGYGSSLGRLATYMRDAGVQVPKAQAPLFVEYTADHMLPVEQETAKQVMQAPVLSQYGSSEAGGLAQQCQQGNLHISTDHLYVEFLRPDGSPADPGESADIVVTTLNNYAMPLVRYAVGDVGSYSDKPCTCGVNLPLMNLELGKAVELISTSERDRVSAHIFDYANIYLMREGIKGIKQYYVEQLAPDEFRLCIIPTQADFQQATDVFVSHMKKHLGERISVEVRAVDSLAVSASGKRRYFDKRF